MLGKRKRNARVDPHDLEGTDQDVDMHGSTPHADIFRKHFEAIFAPLPEEPSRCPRLTEEKRESSEDSDLGSEVSEWSGLSESGSEVPVVEVVDHAIAENGEVDEFHRAQQKKFMSSRPPSEISTITNRVHPTKQSDEEDPVEKMHLKHDLDLQRLLKESHLLDKSRGAAGTGKQRQVALDLRLQELGAKTSVSSQQKMPMAHRKGIIQKGNQFESRRRKEAKENGVIPEKATKKATKNTRRDRGLDAPGVGQFTGGTLKLSRRDISSIQGPAPAAGRKGKRR